MEEAWHPNQGRNEPNRSYYIPPRTHTATTSPNPGTGFVTGGTSASGMKTVPQGPFTIVDADTKHPIRANRVNQLSRAFDVGDTFVRQHPDRDYKVLDAHFKPVTRGASPPSPPRRSLRSSQGGLRWM